MEEKQKLSNVSLARLTNEDTAALINLTIDDALLAGPEIGEMARAALTELDQTGRAFRAQTNRSKKSQLTDQMNLERKVCIDGYAEIKKTVVYETSSRIEPRKKAAIDLEFFLKPNWDITKGPIGDQIDQTVKMISLYRTTSQLVNAGQTISIDMLMDELEANNAALSVTFK